MYIGKAKERLEKVWAIRKHHQWMKEQRIKDKLAAKEEYNRKYRLKKGSMKNG